MKIKNFTKFGLAGLSLMMAHFAWALPADVTVLKKSGDCYLVKTKEGREAVYVTSNGMDLFIGNVGKVRAGTKFYHWGHATPEQAKAWDAAGKISPELLDYLISTNKGAYGGGFYASLSRTNSMGYGNTQITLTMPNEFKVIDQAENPRNILNQSGINKDIAALGIAAFRNSTETTWYNFIESKALTKEHVTQLKEWRFGWRDLENKASLMKRFPELSQDPRIKFEEKMFFNNINLLKHPDLNVRLNALEYFYSSNLLEETKLALQSTYEDGKNNPRFKKIIKELFSSDINTSRHFVALEVLTGRQDSESLALLKPLLADFAISTLEPKPADLQKIYNGLGALQGRQDSESLLIIKSFLNSPNTSIQRRALAALSGRHDSASFEILKSKIDLPKDSPTAGLTILFRNDAISALTGRGDTKTLKLLKGIILNPNEDSTTRQKAIMALKGRQDPASLEILEGAYKNFDSDYHPYISEALKGRQDAKSLTLILQIIENSSMFFQEDAYLALAERPDQASRKIMKEHIEQNKVPSFLYSKVLPFFYGVDEKITPTQANNAAKTFSNNDENLKKYTGEILKSSVQMHIKNTTMAPSCNAVFGS